MHFQVSQEINIDSCNETMFIIAIREIEIEEVTKKFEGKYSAGNDELPGQEMYRSY